MLLRQLMASALFVVLLATAVSAGGLTLRPAPVTAWSAPLLVQEGIRTGNAQFLRLAWQRYEEAIALDPQSMDGYLMLGRIYFHLSLLGEATGEEAQRAISIARRAVQVAPNSPTAHHVLGVVLSGKGQYPDAMASLELAFALNPTNEFVLVDMAAIHNALHQPAQTIAMLEGKPIRHGWSYYVLAMAWLQQGSRGRALLNLQKARRLGFSGFWIDQAMALIRTQTNLNLPPPGR